jgi:hypothetical protein
MKRLLIIAILLCNAVIAQNLPKSINVRFTKYLELHTYSPIPLDSALANPDERTYETTDCEYVLDFENMECRVYSKGDIHGKAPIIAVKQLTPKYETEFDHWEYVVKLQDSADVTEIWLDVERNIFMYTFVYDLEEGFYERVIQWPLGVEIDINN